MGTIPGSARGLRDGTIGNPIDYDPPPVVASTTLSSATVDSLIDGAMTTVSPADGGSFTVDDSTGFPDPPSSTLAADIETGDNTVEVVDGTDFADAGVFKVGSERISYAEKGGNFLYNIRRGALGTTEAASHLTGADVRQSATAIVEREPIAYYTLVGNVLGDIIREAPAEHADNSVCAVSADVSVASVSGLSEPGRIEVGSEVISYRTISGTTLEGIGRGVDGTTVEAHAVSSAVEALAYPRIESAVPSIAQRSSRPLFLPNSDTVELARGTLVTRASSGGGFVAASEGEPIIGILDQATNVGAWGRVFAAGVASVLLDVTASEPNPSEPIFVSTSTSVKALADALYLDEAIGYCLRVHDFDYDGTTALSPKRVDFVMVSQMTRPYTDGGADAGLLPYTSISSNTVFDASHLVVMVDASGGEVTVTLPSVAANAGRRYFVKKTDVSSNYVIIDGDTADLVEGETTMTLASSGDAAHIFSDGSEWRII